MRFAKKKERKQTKHIPRRTTLTFQLILAVYSHLSLHRGKSEKLQNYVVCVRNECARTRVVIIAFMLYFCTHNHFNCTFDLCAQLVAVVAGCCCCGCL